MHHSATTVAILVLLSATCVIATGVLPNIRIDPVYHRFIDEFGRTRIFHGINIVEKEPPFVPSVQVSEAALELYEEMGFNAARLGVLWIGAEPSQGQINQSYIDTHSGIVASLASHGIYTIVDSHQDVYSPTFCGDGFPSWAAVPSPHAAPFAGPIFARQPIDNQTGYPTECGTHSWASYYLTQAACTTFQNLYSNAYGLRDAFVAYWSALAENFANNSNVLGLELINEPFAGDFYSDPTLLIPSIADRKNLQGFYDVLNTAIRLAWADHIIFYEGVTWDLTPSGFITVPGGSEFADRSVLSVHYYCWVATATNMTRLAWQVCNLTESDFFAMRQADVRRLGGALFLSEFGLCDAHLPDLATECLKVLDAADSFLESWTYWDASELIDGNGRPIVANVPMFSRTYVYATAGLLLSMSFDAASAAFKLVYDVNLTCPQPTEVYLNEKINYPDGYQVAVSPAGALSWTQAHNRVFFRPAAVTQEETVVVSITRL